MSEFANGEDKYHKQEGMLNVFVTDAANIIDQYSALLVSIEEKANSMLQFEPEPKDPENGSKETNSAIEALMEIKRKMNNIKERIIRIDKHLSNIIS